MAQFIQLTVYTTHEASEIISDMLWEFTDNGVVINDIEDVIELSKSGKTWDYIDEDVLLKDKTVLVSAYFPLDTASNTISQIESRLLDYKRDAFIDFGTLETVKKQIDGDKWREEWKEHFKPIHIGKVVIVPEWIKYTAKKGEIIVYLDSNMAFGTGEHETTSMCVEKLAQYVKSGDTVLDVGCGSGILGITASKLGAKKVIMTDIDECAVTSSTHNCTLNGVTNATVLLKNLLDDNSVKGDIIVCNIMAEVLCAFAPYISQNLNENGIIILSGILSDRLQKVIDAYAENGFKYIESKVQGEWSCLVMSVNK